jgi:hypothetical protein
MVFYTVMPSFISLSYGLLYFLALTNWKFPWPRGRMSDADQWQKWKIQEWLILLLRFAVTRDQNDRSAALAFATELDRAGSSKACSPTFFLRTSQEVCQAIVGEDDPTRLAVLSTHCRRIEDDRLRRTFRTAVGLETASHKKNRKSRDLWKRLRPR